MPPFFNSLKGIMKSQARPEDATVTPLDFIFSCSVCGDTFSEVYKGPNRTVQGLSDGSSPQDRIVTRLYVGECSHVICIKHIADGNGPPFHREGEQPQSPCQACIEEGAGDNPQKLYALRGFGKDDFDVAIPRIWFVTPPKTINGLDTETGALRFQYLALMRYAKLNTITRKQAQQEVDKMQKEREKHIQAIQNLQIHASTSHDKVTALEQEVQHLREQLRSLEQDSRELARYRQRSPTIRHYLNLLPKVIDQNDQMRARLNSLGFGMHFEPLPNYPHSFPLDDNGNWIDEEPDMEAQKPALSQTTERYAPHMGGYPGESTSSSSHAQRPHKRPRLESPAPNKNSPTAPSSRDMMPPPAKPVSRMQSMRNLIPSSVRKKFKRVDRKGSATGAPMYAGYSESASQSPQPSSEQERRRINHAASREDHHMSGALPLGDPSQSMAPSAMGPDQRRGEFTFRSQSPVKLSANPAHTLPTNRSYIQLMDNLGQDRGLDFGIQDPRQQASEKRQYAHQNSQAPQDMQVERDTPVEREHRNSGQTFHLHQYNGASSPALRQPDGLRSHPVDQSMSNFDQITSFNPITPIPASFHRPVDEPKNFVSPNFGSNNPRSQLLARADITERHHRPKHSADYRFPEGSRFQVRETEYHEPPSLNGLSFFDSPVNERHEPIDWRREPKSSVYMERQHRYQARNLDSRGYITRPEPERSQRRRDSTYSSLDSPAQYRQAPFHSRQAVPFRSLDRSAQSNVVHATSKAPSIVSSYSPIRGRSQRINMEKFGIKSSSKSRQLLPPRVSSPSRALYSSCGRPSIRR